MLNSFSVGCGNSHLWPWQYPLFVVAVSIFLWQHTFGLGSIHLLLLLLQYPLFVVAGQVFCSMWCVAGASLGVIFKPYPVTTSQQRIVLEQTAKSIVYRGGSSYWESSFHSTHSRGFRGTRTEQTLRETSYSSRRGPPKRLNRGSRML